MVFQPFECRGRERECGFTLVELMITLGMSSLVVFAIYSAYILQQKTYYSQDQVIEIQQNLRAGFDTMIREIRMAGYDPTGSNNFSITTATGSRIVFDIDLDEDGNTGGVNESIDYALSGTTLTRNAQAIAENIQAIEFLYLDEDGNLLAYTDIDEAGEQNERDGIRSVRISLLARSGQRDGKYINSNVYTSASGSQFGSPFNDNFRRRFFVTTVHFRNMGI